MIQDEECANCTKEHCECAEQLKIHYERNKLYAHLEKAYANKCEENEKLRLNLEQLYTWAEWAEMYMERPWSRGMLAEPEPPFPENPNPWWKKNE